MATNQNIPLVGVSLGFSIDNLIEDTKENLAELLGRVVRTVAEDRDQKRVYSGNPYNNIAYNLQPKMPSHVRGDQENYYDQRISIYQAVIKLVESTRKNFASSLMCEFLSDMEDHIRTCIRYKQQVKEAKEWSARFKALYLVA